MYTYIYIRHKYTNYQPLRNTDGAQRQESPRNCARVPRLQAATFQLPN